MRSDLDDQRLLAAADWVARLELQDASQADIDEWAAWCRADKDNYAAYERVEELWLTATLHPPAAPVVATLIEERNIPRVIGRALRVAALRRLSMRRTAFLAIPVIAVLLGLFGYIFLIDSKRIELSEALASRLAENRRVVLPDGTEVALGGLSTVTIQYTRAHRLVILKKGEVYVRDSHVANWPFVVRAGAVEIVAKGTSFDTDRTKDSLAVNVVDGIVSVSMNRPARSGSAGDEQRADAGGSVELMAGDKLVVSAGGQMQLYRTDPRTATGWLKGRLEYSGATLTEVLESVNRYSSRPIIIGDPAIGSLKFTGTVFLHSIDAWVDSLPSVFPIQIEKSDARITLKQ